jgi:DNA-binding IclR family transcriptional regulator
MYVMSNNRSETVRLPALYPVRVPADERTSAVGQSQTLSRGLRMLRVLATHPDGLTASELAAELETHRQGVYRLLGSLLDERLVSRETNGRYVLGLGLLDLASAVRPRLQEIAARELRILADELQATAALTVRDGDEAVVAVVVEPRHTDMHLTYRQGLRHPVGIAASGIAILAGNQPAPGERPQVTAARALGYAVSTGELLAGATGVAAPIAIPGRDVEASISAVWTGQRDPAAAAESVMRTAKAIAAALVGG